MLKGRYEFDRTLGAIKDESTHAERSARGATDAAWRSLVRSRFGLRASSSRGQLDLLPLPLPVLLTLQVAQMSVLMFVGAVVGLKLGAAVGLGSPVARTCVMTKPY